MLELKKLKDCTDYKNQFSADDNNCTIFVFLEYLLPTQEILTKYEVGTAICYRLITVLWLESGVTTL